jgi:CheY-like chemotaxis protein
MSGEPILIVDDSALSSKLTLLVLEGEGYDIRIASSAEQALAILREFRPRLILMDRRLPGMDGLELTRRLKADPERQEVVIIALTAHAMDSDRQLAFDAGCDDYVSKPIDTEALPRLVADWLAGRSR